MGSTPITPASDTKAWNRMRQNAGYTTSDDHSIHSAQTVNDDEHWHDQPPAARSAHEPSQDHLYNLIDVPGRDDNKRQLFGMAKAFPQVTRHGYLSYLQNKLSKESEHGEAGGSAGEGDEQEHGSTAASDDETKPQKDTRRHKAFALRDYGPFYRFRLRFHAEMAEFLGMFVFLAIGYAATCQSIVGGEKSTYTTVVFAWGFAQMAGIYVAGGYSGAHLNPVLTLNLWFFRGFPFRRMLSFWIAQFFGAFAATAWIFLLYYPALRQLDPKGWSLLTGEAFYTAPANNIPIATAWFSEVTNTALIHIIIFAVGDSHNISPARGMNALVLGFTVTAMGSAFGYLTPFGMNPTRDFAPRIFLSMVGFPKQLWTFKDWWWVTGEITGPLVGGFVGASAYDLFIFDGPESPVNFPKGVKRRAIKFWVEDVLHPFNAQKLSRAERHLPERAPGYNENPYRGTVHLQGQPAQ